MKVSIIIPVYNVEKYIERCINSVIRQTYTNIECIIVDDCSTDNSANICTELIAKYSGPIKFVIIHHKEGQGPSGARNTGTDASTGEYIFYLDSDDEITPDCIALLFETAQKHPKAEIIQGCTIALKNKGYYSLSQYNDIDYIDNKNWIYQYFFCIDNSLPVDVWNKLIQKRFLTKHNIRFHKGIIHEDQLWSYNVITKLQSMYLVHHDTYIHYSVPMSIMTSLTNEKSYKSWGIILETIVPLIKEPYSELQIRKYLLEYINKHQYYIKENIHTKLIDKFAKKACTNKNIKLATAIWIYKTLSKYNCGYSIKQWITTYCRYKFSDKLFNEILADSKALISKVLRKRNV